ncbi:dTDP-4-dehydrorhamnose reductase [Granulicella sp. dw_53]|uniref:dTDP-4-dehydrorhamnose reductase n=1 Tax=Granulicella sp. dw_53 TaxID=2719792 RepID=UPI001BD58317|nr:dTDP-4-dehydrorhamnose reductase [Granulicella sp. dw_53]
MAAAMTERILLTGASGQVGGELVGTLAPLGEVVAPGRGVVDLADSEGDFRSLREMIQTIRPRWIVNPAAYTAVDKAESEPEVAYAINRDAVRAIGEEAQKIGASVLHFSTDYVFDGLGSEPYLETDTPGPMSVYGKSKLAGEVALAESGAAHIVFRTSWVYGGRSKNFLLTILKLARERETVRVVGDQYGAPTWSRDLAAVTAAVMQRCEADAGKGSLSDTVARAGGIYHASGAGVTTWHGFAAEAVRQQREREPGVKLAEIEAITTAEYPTPARRPENSRLNCNKLADRFGWKMMAWQDSLHKVLAEI